MADRIHRRYVTTVDAARYFGVTSKTFLKMINAVPASRRPKKRVFPAMRQGRWDLDELDSALNAANASQGWDRILGGWDDATQKSRRVG